VYFEASRGPYAAGEKSFIGQTLTRLGARNVSMPAGAVPAPEPRIVVRADPDFIMAGERSLENRACPIRAGADAGGEAGRCAFTAELDILVRPGPRMAEGAR
jgi:iron complex transport system substrate-binding protein